jgi:hypothetical protein
MSCRSRFRPSPAGQRVAHRLLAAGFAVLLGTSALLAADEETQWTVLTVARNGNWGIAAASTQGEAIASALRKCQTMTADESDCGAEFVAFRSGLALALMCGDYRVMVTADNAEEADRSALDRLLALRDLYGPEFPACQHLLRIDSQGVLTTFKARRIDSGYSSALPK